MFNNQFNNLFKEVLLMNKKQEAHFANLPKVNMSRSRFDMDHDLNTSFNTGQLIPLGQAFEVLPGDTIKWSTSSLVRLTTLRAPIMSNLFFDTYFFFVPFRLIWEHYTNFLGENDSTPWVSETTYSIPQVKSPTGGWSVGSLADYFGIATGVGNLSVSALPFRAYAKIVKDWFYDENSQYPPDFILGDATIQGNNGTNYVTDLAKGGMPFNIAKLHDIFTSCLPAPQKGDSVLLPLGNIDLGTSEFPVISSGVKHSNASLYEGQSADFQPMTFSTESGGATNIIPYNDSNKFLTIHTGNLTSRGYAGDITPTFPFYSGGLYPDNLVGKFGGSSASASSSTTINDLRLAFQTQRLLERMARGGTRYFEILASQWGVIAPQGLIQRSEYLGGSRSDIRVNTVVQTSSTDSTSPQGNLTGYSVSTNKHRDFIKSFSEPGYIIGLGAVRYMHLYSQGIPKTYMRKDRFDFYNQAFAFIGEQPIMNYQIYAQGTNQDYEVFGYNEAWVDYRYMPNMITGEMRPTAQTSLDVWHLGDHYTSLPRLSSGWLMEDKSNVDRVITVSSNISNQFVADIYFNIDAIRPMPLYSIPGLIDHM